MSKPTDWNAESLEKAAKFLKELDKSSNAKAAIELAKREHDVEIAREATRAKEFETQAAQMRAQSERIKWEEQRKTMDHKAQNEKDLVQYKFQSQRKLAEEEDQLARKRDEDNRRRALEDERIKAGIRQKAEEEIQNERRRTEEHRAKLERENMRARAVAEAEGRIKEQRENEEIHQRQLKVRLTEERQTKIDSINAYFRHLGEAANSFLTQPSKIGAAALAVSAVFLGIWGTREGVRVVGRAIEKRIGTPPLVRDTSRLTNHFALRKRLARAVGLGGEEEGYSFSDVILRREISDRISRLSTSVANTKSNGAPFRHMLFYGPPGTGKTMVAKRLARSTGLDYAIMSGGDVGPLGRDAVTELHRLFDWANTSKRGLLLFIDEADAFLASRSRSNMSEEQRNALNALLYRTGENSKNFMMVLATNRPGDLDRAVADRVDEAMVFDLPDLEARKKLVKQYYKKFILDAGKEAKWGPFGLLTRPGARITIGEGLDDAYLDQLASRLDGFSGREISKLFISAQGDVYGRPAPRVLTKNIMEEIVGWKLKEHQDKNKFSSDASFDFVAAGSRSTTTGSAAAVSAAFSAASSPAKAADKPLR